MYQWNFNIKLQFTNFSLFISDADFQSKSNNWIPWSRSTILYLILILILIFILGETRDRGSVWSLDQQQQQQQPRICMDIASYYGIVSYAVGVSLILSVAGIKSGRRFFHLFNRRRRHAARHTDQIVGNGHDERLNNGPPPRDHQEEQLELGDLMGGMESVNRDRVFTDNPEVSGQESGRGSTSRCHALEGQKWKWFDQISCQWVPKESVCNDLFR